MSVIIFTPREQTEKTHTITDAVNVYKQLQFDNNHNTVLNTISDLYYRHQDNPKEMITLVELNKLVEQAQSVASRQPTNMRKVNSR